MKWLSLLLLGGCAAPMGLSHDMYGAVDPFGYAQPVECRRDLSFAPRTVFRVPPSHPALHPPGLRHLIARTMEPVAGMPPIIYISTAVPSDQYVLVLHHEECHLVAGHWHAEVK